MEPIVLLVEDDQFKRQRISELLEQGIGVKNVVCAGSVMSAIEKIDSQVIRLVILDLAIPDYDEGGDVTHGLGGLTVFRYLRQMMGKVPVVVITQFEALDVGGEVMSIATIRDDIKKEFKDQFLGLVQYQPTIDGWKEHLLELIGKVGVR